MIDSEAYFPAVSTLILGLITTHVSGINSQGSRQLAIIIKEQVSESETCKNSQK